MANAKRDDNYITTLLGTSNADDATPIRVYADPTTRRLLVDSVDSVSGYSAVGTGNGSVTTAGTAVQVAANACKRVIITNNSENSSLTNGGGICIGGSAVVAAEATRQGLFLYPTQSQAFMVSNTNLLYVDSLDNAAKFHFYYEN